MPMRRPGEAAIGLAGRPSDGTHDVIYIDRQDLLSLWTEKPGEGFSSLKLKERVV